MTLNIVKMSLIHTEFIWFDSQLLITCRRRNNYYTTSIYITLTQVRHDVPDLCFNKFALTGPLWILVEDPCPMYILCLTLSLRLPSHYLFCPGNAGHIASRYHIRRCRLLASGMRQYRRHLREVRWLVHSDGQTRQNAAFLLLFRMCEQNKCGNQA